jgi:hypothetical protein
MGNNIVAQQAQQYMLQHTQTIHKPKENMWDLDTLIAKLEEYRFPAPEMTLQQLVMALEQYKFPATLPPESPSPTGISSEKKKRKFLASFSSAALLPSQPAKTKLPDCVSPKLVLKPSLKNISDNNRKLSTSSELVTENEKIEKRLTKLMSISNNIPSHKNKLTKAKSAPLLPDITSPTSVSPIFL